MRISVHESETLAAIVAALILKFDPDYPADDCGGISVSVSEHLVELFGFATDYVTPNYHYPDDVVEHVMLIRNDPVLFDIVRLPWVHALVQDLHGTIVLVF